MTIEYGGIKLVCPTTTAAAWIQERIPLGLVYEFPENFLYPGSRRLTWPAPVFPPLPPIQLGKLHYPWGAQRFAVYHGLVKATQLKQLRRLAYRDRTGQLYRALPLTLDEGDVGRTDQGYTITTDLWMLPPRPLAQMRSRSVRTGRRQQLYLLTLVDERFFWPLKSTNLTVTAGTTTWSELIATIADALGTTITVDTIAPEYLRPPGDLASAYDTLPPLLDAVLYSIQHRLVRKLDGTFITQNADTAADVQDDQLVAWKKLAGGQFDLEPTARFTEQDFTAQTPEQVNVYFPGTGRLAQIALTSLDHQRYPSGFAGQDERAKLFRHSAIASDLRLDALAERLAYDWYTWITARQAVKYAGIVPYEPEAMSDHVEWSILKDDEKLTLECSTRVERGPLGEWASGGGLDVFGFGFPLGNGGGGGGTDGDLFGSYTEIGLGISFNSKPLNDGAGTGKGETTIINLKVPGKLTIPEDGKVVVEDGATVTVGEATITYNQTIINKTNVTQNWTGGDVFFSNTNLTHDNTIVTIGNTSEWTWNDSLITVENGSEVFFHESEFHLEQVNNTWKDSVIVIGGTVPAGDDVIVTLRDDGDDTKVIQRIETTNATRDVDIWQVAIGDGTGTPGTGVVRVRVDKDGFFILKPKPDTEPDDEDLDEGEFTYFIDPDDGEVKIKYKDLDGNVSETPLTGTDSDSLVAITPDDTTPGYLFDKIDAGTGITLTVVNPGGNETLSIEASGGGGASGSHLTDSDGQTINSATTAALAFNTETDDDGGYHDAGSPTRQTIPTGKGGWHVVGGYVDADGSTPTTGFYRVFLRLNGSTVLSVEYSEWDTGAHMSTSVVYKFDDADYIELVLQNSTDTSISFLGNDTAFWIHKLD